jgi:4-carboxymuconolactone decarboxylase
MPRIAPVSPPYPKALSDRLSRLLPPGMSPPQLFLTVARNESLFLHLVDTGWLGPTGLLDRRTLARPLRELLILRTCAATRNEYEWHLHANTISGRMGLSDLQIDDTREATPNAALWSGAELAAIELVDALVGSLAIDDTLFERLRVHFDEAQLIEMTHLVGLYTTVAMMVALARPRLDDYARPEQRQEKCVKRADRPDSVREAPLNEAPRVAAIRLGRASRHGSMPPTRRLRGATSSPAYLVLLRVEIARFTRPADRPREGPARTPTRLCCSDPHLAVDRCYLLRCPVQSGPSSSAAFQHHAPAAAWPASPGHYPGNF